MESFLRLKSRGVMSQCEKIKLIFSRKKKYLFRDRIWLNFK